MGMIKNEIEGSVRGVIVKFGNVLREECLVVVVVWWRGIKVGDVVEGMVVWWYWC